jgi:ketosteroid isomerase-like protein
MTVIRILLFTFFALIMTPLQAATPQAIVADLQKQWSVDFTNLDADALASHYSADATLFGSKPVLYVGREEITGYFRTMPSGLKGVRFDDQHVSQLGEGIIATSGFATFFREINGTVTEFPYRITWVLVEGKDGWKISTHHFSPKP